MERRRNYALPVARTSRRTRRIARANYEGLWEALTGVAIILMLTLLVKDVGVAILRHVL